MGENSTAWKKVKESKVSRELQSISGQYFAGTLLRTTAWCVVAVVAQLLVPSTLIYCGFSIYYAFPIAAVCMVGASTEATRRAPRGMALQRSAAITALLLVVLGTIEFAGFVQLAWYWYVIAFVANYLGFKCALSLRNRRA